MYVRFIQMIYPILYQFYIYICEYADNRIILNLNVIEFSRSSFKFYLTKLKCVSVYALSMGWWKEEQKKKRPS